MNGSEVSSISIEEVKVVLNNLKAQNELIKNTFKNEIVNVLQLSESCLSVAGLDYSKIYDSLNETFTKVDERFINLINALDGVVIKNYNQTSDTVSKMFNNDFANQLSDLLDVNNN